MAGTTVTVQGADELRIKLGRTLQPVEKAIAELAAYVNTEAKRRAKPHAADKGTLGNVIATSLSGGGANIKAEVYVPYESHVQGIAWSIEEGRPPDKRPSLARIAVWAFRHGYLANDDLAGVYRLAQRIKSQGTKGVYFMRDAAEAGTKKAQETMANLKIQIEEMWAR